jgi:hypothetical protein
VATTGTILDLGSDILDIVRDHFEDCLSRIIMTTTNQSHLGTKCQNFCLDTATDTPLGKEIPQGEPVLGYDARQ